MYNMLENATVLDYTMIRFISVQVALIHLPSNTITPFVVAYDFNPESFTWLQGHYHSTIESAKEHFQKYRKEGQ